MVLVLVGILSAGAMSLFSSRGAYASFIAKDQLISGGMLAQQIALAYQSATIPASLVVSLDTTTKEWVFQVKKAGMTTPVSELRTETSGAVLTITRSNGVAVPLPATFRWDRQANIFPRFGYKFTFTGENSATVCLSSAGFAYASGSGFCP